MYFKKQFISLRKKSVQNGFSIIELVAGIAVFAILVTGVLGAYSALSQSVKVAREKTTLSALAAQDLEIVRNLPYSQVGTLVGNPSGQLPDLTNPRLVSIEGRQYKIYYEVTYVDDPADGTILLGTDVAPNDYKQVKMFIQNVATSVITNFLTSVSPKGLEGLSNAGAILVKVFNASGQPVAGASVHIENLARTPDIVLDRQTDASGNWAEVGLPAWVNGYHIVVTKNGYSTDQTYPITVQNPNPTKPDATVVNGQVTQVSFSIDLLSNLNIKTLDTNCQNLNGVGMNVLGAKLIGINPDVYKFNQNFSSSNGLIALNNIEWDTYTPTLLANQNLMVYGTSPIQQVTVLPGTSQTFTIILGTQTTNSLLVIVKDAATGTALEGAIVHLRKGGSQPQDYYATTGGSVWVQQSWTGGPGSVNFTPATNTRYFSDDGNVDINSNPTGIRLNKISGRYVASGILESSAFDTGTNNTNFTTITWQPTSQDAAATLKFQIASNNDNATWDYKGPDGTDASFYTVSGTTISSVHDNNRYLRYKVFESTTDDRITPVLTNIAINYVSGCFTPGQVMFPGLTSGNNYDLDVTLSGYQTEVVNNLTITANQTLEVLMSP